MTDLKKETVLFLNHSVENCGVYQYGKRVYGLVQSRARHFDWRYEEVNNYDEYLAAVQRVREEGVVVMILYNYHNATMPWAVPGALVPGFKHIAIPHECPCPWFDEHIEVDPSVSQGYGLPRPLWDEDVVEKMALPGNCKPSIRSFIEAGSGEEGVPVIGSFGFGFDNKGFHKIVEWVCKEFDQAIVKLVIPIARFDPDRIGTVQVARRRCEEACKKPGVRLMIIHDFLSDEELMVFLRGNTANLFLYDKMYGRGISSALDYALSAKRPVGISDSWMFRHVYRDDICVYKVGVKGCIENHAFVEGLNCKANNDALVEKLENILDAISKK